MSSARYLSERLKQYGGIHATALYTLDFTTLSSYFRPSVDLFDEQVLCQSDKIDVIIKSLGTRHFDYVVNGCDSLVWLSDQLANHYTPNYANSIHSSHLRSDKYQMHHALAKNQLAHIHQILYDASSEALPELGKLGINYPCFVKPLAGLGTLGARKINDPQQLESYFTNYHIYDNFCQTKDTQNQFLIAELVEGDEVLVDAFSINGEHYISTIQRYTKNRNFATPIYESWEIVTDQLLIDKISNYTRSTLTATEFKNGFSHTELFVTAEGMVKLIEINPRISGAGGFVNKTSILSGGTDQISLLMKHVFNLELSGSSRWYPHVKCLILNNLSGKPLYNLKANLGKYSAVCEILQLVKDGHIQKNSAEVSFSDAAAFVLLASDVSSLIEEESRQIMLQDKLGWE